METQYGIEELPAYEQQVQEAITQIINTHIYHEELRELLLTFVKYKRSETSIWPKLTLYTHFMLGGASPHIYHAAAQTELIILSLDILDDLHDQDNTEPPWMSCDHNVAMNAASALLLAAIAGNLTAPALNTAGLRLITAAHNGQHRDIRNEVKNEEQYLHLIGEKSSSLITLAIMLGCLETDTVDDSGLELLTGMAANIGIAAQLDNDMRNMTRIDYRNDLVHRKITLSTLFLLEQSDIFLPLVREYYNGNCEQKLFLSHKNEIIDFINKSGVIEYTSAVQMLYAQQASRQLDQLNLNPHWKHEFKQMSIGKFLKNN